MIKIFLVLLTWLLCNSSWAYPIQDHLGHFYFGLGQNFNLQGNIRLGYKDFEFGLIQNTGYGFMLLQRTSTPFFIQAGALFSNGGGVLAGGGMEWDNSSWFRFRADVTVGTTINYETQSVVSAGGVFIL